MWPENTRFLGYGEKLLHSIFKGFHEKATLIQSLYQYISSKTRCSPYIEFTHECAQYSFSIRYFIESTMVNTLKFNNIASAGAEY